MKFIVPIRIQAGGAKSKIHSLNLNIYRNLNFHCNNSLKKKFRKIVLGELESMNPAHRMEKAEQASISYRIYFGSRRRTDIGNWCSVIQKFTEDALVSAGVIEDDDFKTVTESHFYFGGVDKENPRCEVEIIEIGVRK